MNNSHILWAINILNDKGYHIHSDIPDIVQDNPWSVVYQFKTDQGFIFLKKTPPSLSIEPEVINVLHREFQANVPVIIAGNQDQHCFLMEDAGIRLNDYFKQVFKSDILIQAIKDYTRLQKAASNKVEQFLNLGVPDWRLDKLPKLYHDLIAQKILLIDDGLSGDELIELNKLEPKFYSICEQLSLYKIKETFSHGDFHDKNILINAATNKITLIDLGEVVITHPFFSFLNCLYRAKENFSLSVEEYHQLQLVCFEPWLALETQEHLFKILAIIQQCWPIHSALAEFRLMQSVDQSAFKELSRQGRLAKNLRHWINQ